MTAVEGRLFGRYRVVATLGRGGMGEVYAAIDDVLGREVAIKTLRGANGELGSRLLDERFRHEARAIASLAHPGVVQVFDLDVAASPPYLVMERVMGPSLATRLETGPLALDELRTLGVQIARALAAAHDQGIIHRDVKPGNILAAGGGRWKLADFGVAHVPDSSLTLTGQFIGSPAYAAPEALTRGELGAPADVFGLGATLYQAASGRWPRSEPTSPGIAALLAPPPPLRGLAPHVPATLAAAIEQALAPDPSKRPTADQLARAIAEGVEVAPTLSPSPSPSPSPSLSSSLSSSPSLSPSPSLSSSPSLSPSPSLSSSPSLSPSLSPSPSRSRLPWIAAGAALLVGIVIGVGQRSCGGSGGPGSTTPASLPTFPAAGTGNPTITATPPPGLTGKAAKDWNKIVDKLYDNELGEARDKLAEFERKYGRTQETADLATQLDALGFQGWDDDDRGPPGRRGKHGD